MNNRSEIGRRIKLLRKKNNFSQAHVASILYISQAAYSLIESSQNGIVVDHILKLSKLYKVTTDYLLTGENNYIKIGRDTGFVPFIRAHIHDKFLQNLESDDIFDIKDWFRIPGFDFVKDQTLFEVKSENMSPTIFPGDVLICQVHHNIDQVLDGSAVVVITVDGIRINRIRRDADENYFVMENDNPAATEGNGRISKNELRKVMMISGKISNVLVSSQAMADNGKIQELEKGIDLLKSELLEMNHRLYSFTEKKQN
ncbi:XRE family transcriptional regulator [Christiangramia aquimixticola]|uniref:XRE family transcriptional regulator n=1 Tax=Christiangramia aquimixticola TaxID=1697558 RepID=UPI003AA9791B